MDRFILFCGAVLGLSGVIAGALFDHVWAAYMNHAAETALRYHQLYALLITALGLVLAYADLKPGHRKYLRLTSGVFAVGTVLFSGSLYALSFTGIPQTAYAAPIGGLTLMAGWGVLGAGAIMLRR